MYLVAFREVIKCCQHHHQLYQVPNWKGIARRVGIGSGAGSEHLSFQNETWSQTCDSWNTNCLQNNKCQRITSTTSENMEVPNGVHRLSCHDSVQPQEPSYDDLKNQQAGAKSTSSSCGASACISSISYPKRYKTNCECNSMINVSMKKPQ